MKKKTDFIPPNKTRSINALFFRTVKLERTWTNEKKAALFPRLIRQVVSEPPFDALNAPH